MKRLLWFLIAGIGFLIDAGLTHLLIVVIGLNPFIARIPAITAAIGFTWLVSRSLDLGRSPRSLATEGLRCRVVGTTSALINYAVYAMLMSRAPFLQPVIAVTASTLAATAYSFFGYSRFIFRHRND